MKNRKIFTKELMKQLWRLCKDERGQSTTEYILILSVVVMIAIKFKTAFGSKIDSIVTKLGGDIDQNISN
jgi:Flp pilus assembly pilin Flp